MTYCAPNLPFFETVLWYAKQMGAVVLISGVCLGAYFGAVRLIARRK